MMNLNSRRVLLVCATLIGVASSAAAQGGAGAGGRGAAEPGRGGGGGRGFQGQMDSVRARQLYMSNDPKDAPRANFAAQIVAKNRTDSIHFARFKGLLEVRKIVYPSRADGMMIPAYVFAPLNKRGPNGHAAMIWVHQGIHANWDESLLPFVKEAVVDRGYVLITPEYRGSTGFGEAHYMAIDYGGYEVDDVISAMDVLRLLPYVDMRRVGMMGWSHGGFITMHNATRPGHGLRAAASLVPVTDLFFRLSLKGPGYVGNFSTETRVRAAPFENVEEYTKRSPVYQVEKLDIPMLVHISTNDLDVNYVEDQMMVWKLQALKPDLAETKIYVDPPGWGGSVGHAFDRRVDPVTLERLDTPEQIDSWNRIWTFFDSWLRPYENRAYEIVPVREQP